MISVAEARAIMLRHAFPTGAESVALEAACGRTLFAPVHAVRPQPPFTASMMDGYAVRSADTPGRINLIGEAGAGRPLHRALGAGECARIFTGAPLPDGADAVAIQEDVVRTGDTVEAPQTSARANVRPIGMDFAAGATLLPASLQIRPGHVGVAAAAGAAILDVARRPRIAILAGGDEIVSPGDPVGPAQIYDSASFGIAALVERWGACAIRRAPLKDDPRAIQDALREASSEFDLTILIGGASVGDHDFARGAIEALGGELLFQKVAVRPGKPTWFAKCGARAVLGLPGNPVSALVCAHLLVRPFIDVMLGRDPAESLTTRRALLRKPITANGPREFYHRARTEVDQDARLWATPADDQDSSLVTVFAAADALIIRAPNAPPAAAGELADILAI
ncbi:MAG: gephyrin-like molybdotransferase Glp [Pseudomonadota bacterium]